LANFKFNPDEFPALKGIENDDRWIMKKFSTLDINDEENNDCEDYEDNSDTDSDYDFCSDDSNYDNNINNDNIEYNILPLEGRKSYLDVLLTPKIDEDITVPITLQAVAPKHKWTPKIVVQPTSYKRKDRLYEEDVKLSRIDYDDDPDDEGIMDIIYSEMGMKGLRVRSRIGASILTPSQQITKDHRISVKKG
jgi:hypothetical protein